MINKQTVVTMCLLNDTPCKCQKILRLQPFLAQNVTQNVTHIYLNFYNIDKKVDENMKIKDGKGGEHSLKECLAQAKDKLAKKKTRKMLQQTMI